MNQSQIDFLFQITTPPSERGSTSVARGEGQLPDFGNHLIEATAIAPRKLTQAAEHGPAVYRPDYGTTNEGDASCRAERFSDESQSSLTDDSIDYASLDESASSTNPSAAAEQHDTEGGECDSDGCKPTSDSSPATQDSASDDDATDSDAEEKTNIVVTVAPPVGTFVSEELVVNSENAVADSTTLVASEPDQKADGNQTPLAVELFSPSDQQHLADTPPWPMDQSSASAATSVESDGLALIPGKNIVDDNGATSATDKKSRKAERAAKRGAAAVADGDEPTRKVANATGDSNQLADAVAAKLMGTADSSEKDPSSETSQTDSSANQTTSTRHTSNSMKGVSTADVNGVVAQPAVQSPQVEAAENSRGKTSKNSGLTKHEALIAAARSTRTNIATRRGAKATAESEEVPRVDPARFVGRVAKAIQTAHERSSTLQLRLSPPELGAVKLALTVKDGVLSAALETETASARRLLLDHLPALRERLAAQNIRIERFDVDVQRDGTGGRPDSQAPQQQQQQHQSRSHSPSRPSVGTTQPVMTPAPEDPVGGHAVLSNSGINVVA